jgi:hypothetical protein
VRIDVKFEDKLASMRYHESSTVKEEKEKQTLKDVQQSIFQTPCGEEDLYPSSPIRRPGWILKKLKDVREAPRSMVREHMPPKKFPNDMVLMSSIIDYETSSFEEAIDQKVWWYSMVEEYTFIIRNDVLEIVPRPEMKLFVSSQWLYKIKNNTYGSIKKFKAWFLVRRFSQKERVDYEETFYPFTRYDYI